MRAWWCRAAAAALAWMAAFTAVCAREVDWSGAWDSRWRDNGASLYLEQRDGVVTGNYPVLDGRLQGAVRGRLLVGEWTDSTGSGHFTFSLAPDGQTFTGRFGTGEWWTGVRHGPGEVGGRITADATHPAQALLSLLRAGNAARDGRTDRLGPALHVLDFSEVPAEERDDAHERLELGAALFRILDLLTFRVWEAPDPSPGEDEVAVRLAQAGTDAAFTLRFRYRVRADGAAGWFIVVPPPASVAATTQALLAPLGGEYPHARAHESLRSPRDTMRTFLEQFHAWQGGAPSPLLLATMNLSETASPGRDDEALLLAQYLKAVIDRVGYVLWQEIPNDRTRRAPYLHFVHPQGTIALAPYPDDEPAATIDGARAATVGERWQFTPETLASIRPLYMALEDMPLDEGVGAFAGSAFFQLRDQIRTFDRDLLQPVVGVELWQWLVLGALFLVSVPLSWLVAWLLLRVILRWRREPDELMGIKARFIWPLQALLVAVVGLFALRILGLPEAVDVPLRVVLGAALSLAGGWLAYHLVDRLGSAAHSASGRFGYGDEMLRSLAVALAKVGVVVGALLLLAEVLSLPYQGVVAGLGIGGLAVALAARSTLENFIGGLTLLADKPIRVGDFCRFGDKLGTIEGIGLRSVKVRSLDRTVFTVPNAEFVNLYLENFTRRDRILLRTVLQLRYETTPDQLRWVLAALRRLFLQHPRVDAEPSRARFTGFGAHSLDIELFAYVNSTDYNEYLSIQEDLFLRMIDIVERSGTGFAFPSQVNYLARDTGVDAARRDAATAEVQEWRDGDRLPFPEFDEDERWHMFNQLDFPPPGSPQSERARRRRAEQRAKAAE